MGVKVLFFFALAFLGACFCPVATDCGSCTKEASCAWCVVNGGDDLCMSEDDPRLPECFGTIPPNGDCCNVFSPTGCDDCFFFPAAGDCAWCPIEGKCESASNTTCAKLQTSVDQCCFQSKNCTSCISDSCDWCYSYGFCMDKNSKECWSGPVVGSKDECCSSLPLGEINDCRNCIKSGGNCTWCPQKQACQSTSNSTCDLPPRTSPDQCCTARKNCTSCTLDDCVWCQQKTTSYNFCADADATGTCLQIISAGQDCCNQSDFTSCDSCTERGADAGCFWCQKETGGSCVSDSAEGTDCIRSARTPDKCCSSFYDCPNCVAIGCEFCDQFESTSGGCQEPSLSHQQSCPWEHMFVPPKGDCCNLHDLCSSCVTSGVGCEWVHDESQCRKSSNSSEGSVVRDRDGCCSSHSCVDCDSFSGCGFCSDTMRCEWKGTSNCSFWTQCPYSLFCGNASIFSEYHQRIFNLGVNVYWAPACANVSEGVCVPNWGSFSAGQCFLLSDDPSGFLSCEYDETLTAQMIHSLNTTPPPAFWVVLVAIVAYAQILYCVVEHFFFSEPIWPSISPCTQRGADVHVLLLEVLLGLSLALSGDTPTLERWLMYPAAAVVLLRLLVLSWWLCQRRRSPFPAGVSSFIDGIVTAVQLIVLVLAAVVRVNLLRLGSTGCGNMQLYSVLLLVLVAYVAVVLVFTTHVPRFQRKEFERALNRPKLFWRVHAWSSVWLVGSVLYPLIWSLFVSPVTVAKFWNSELYDEADCDSSGFVTSPMLMALLSILIARIQRDQLSVVAREIASDGLRSLSTLCSILQLPLFAVACVPWDALLHDNYPPFDFGFLCLSCLGFARVILIQYSLADRFASPHIPSLKLQSIEAVRTKQGEKTATTESGLRLFIRRAFTFLGSWNGAHVMALLNNLQTVAAMGYLLLFSGFDILYYTILTILACIGAFCNSLALLGRSYSRWKFVPTDDGMRLTCILKALLLVVKAIVIGGLGSNTTFLDLLMYFLLVCSLVRAVLRICSHRGQIVMTILTIVDCRFHWKNREVVLSDFRSPRSMLVGYLIGFVWVKLAVLFVMVISHSVLRAIARRSDEDFDCNYVYFSFMLFLPVFCVAAYSNNEMARFLDGRRELFDWKRQSQLSADKKTTRITLVSGDGSMSKCVRVRLGDNATPFGVWAVQPMATLLAGTSLALHLFSLFKYSARCSQTTALLLSTVLVLVFAGRCLLLWVAQRPPPLKAGSAAEFYRLLPAGDSEEGQVKSSGAD